MHDAQTRIPFETEGANQQRSSYSLWRWDVNIHRRQKAVSISGLMVIGVVFVRTG